MYFIAINGKQEGPFTITDLQNKILSNEYLVWKHGWENWISINEVEELKGLVPPKIAVPPDLPTPPPIVKQGLPPITKTKQPVITKKDDKNRLVLLIAILIGGVLIITFLIAILFKRTSKTDEIQSSNSSSNNGEITQSTMAADTNPVYTQEDIKRAAFQAKVVETRKNILSQISVDLEGSNVGLLGGISNARYRLTNHSDFNLDRVIVQVSYIKGDGSVYKYESIEFKDILSGESELTFAPDSDRGLSLQANVAYIYDDALGELNFD